MTTLLLVGLLAAPPSRVQVLWDAYEQLGDAATDNAMDVSPRQSGRAAGVVRSGLMLHPLNERPARATWRLELPALKPGEKLILAGWGGMSDGVQPEQAEMDGIGFGIELDDERQFRTQVDQPGWAPFCLDLGAYAGRAVTLSLVTDDGGGVGNCSFDWALFGDTRLYHLAGNGMEGGRTGVLAGVILAEHPGAGEAVAVRLQPLDETDQPVGEARLVVTTPERTLVEYDVSDVPGAVRLAVELDGADGTLTAAAFAPRIELVSLGPSRGVTFAGDRLAGRAVLKNTGRGVLQLEHQLTVVFAGDFEATRLIDRIDPGAELALPVTGGVAEPGSARLALGVSYQVAGWPESIDEQRTFTVYPARPAVTDLPVAVPKVGRIGAAWGAHYLADATSRVLFWGSGAGPVEFQAVVGGRYRTLATAPSLAEVVVEGGGEPGEWRVSSPAADSLVFTGSVPLAGAARLVPLTVTATIGGRGLDLVHQLGPVPAGGFALRALRGPAVLVGDGTSGTAKRRALFPGLEFLQDDEPSSSTRDFDPPLHLRLVPDPYKVTVPCMSVETEQATVAVMWDPLQTWHGERALPSALFAAPNFIDGQENHRLQLFAPGGVELVPENTLQAAEPYAVGAGETVRLSQRIALLPGATVLDAVDEWIARQPDFPAAETPPRSLADELALCRHAFTASVWDAAAKKSRHCVGWPNLNAPQYATLLLFDSVLSGSAAARDHAELIIETTLTEQGEAGLDSPAGCHILRSNAPFLFGHLDGALETMRRAAYGAAGGMSADGSWGFNPPPENVFLGAPGTVELGTCAPAAYSIWRWIRFSGDRTLLAAGRQALARMDRFIIPAGAQGWECPIHEPDILAAAYAIRAYLEAYRVTRHQPYLDAAVYWARAGLPFNYLWGDPSIPGMTYASIPVFGSTHRTHSWLGLPVQWCGLVYGYALLQLAEVDDTLPYERIARGLTVSGMYQQHGDESPELKGTYPDSWAFVAGRKNGPHINPEDIQVCLLALNGLDPEPRTAILEVDGQALHFTTGADIAAAEVRGNTARLLLHRRGELTTWSVIPFVARPGGITIGGRPARLGDDIDDPAVDAVYDPAQSALFLKVTHGVEPVEVIIGGLRPGRPASAAARASWRFGGGLEGWAAEHHCELKLDGGNLVCTVTGDDPYFAAPNAWFAAADHPRLVVRARASGGNELALFWGTELTPGTSPSRCVTAPLAGDGQWHEVVFDLAGQPGWRGVVNHLRLDPEPADMPVGTTVEIEFIEARRN